MAVRADHRLRHRTHRHADAGRQRLAFARRVDGCQDRETRVEHRLDGRVLGAAAREDREDAVADHVAHVALVLDDRAEQQFEIAIEEARDDLRRPILGEVREALRVGHEAQSVARPARRLLALQQVVERVGRHEAAQQVAQTSHPAQLAFVLEQHRRAVRDRGGGERREQRHPDEDGREQRCAHRDERRAATEQQQPADAGAPHERHGRDECGERRGDQRPDRRRAQQRVVLEIGERRRDEFDARHVRQTVEPEMRRELFEGFLLLVLQVADEHGAAGHPFRELVRRGLREPDHVGIADRGQRARGAVLVEQAGRGASQVPLHDARGQVAGRRESLDLVRRDLREQHAHLGHEAGQLRRFEWSARRHFRQRVAQPGHVRRDAFDERPQDLGAARVEREQRQRGESEVLRVEQPERVVEIAPRRREQHRTGGRRGVEQRAAQVDARDGLAAGADMRAREVRYLDRHDHAPRTFDRAGEVGVDGFERLAFRAGPEARRAEHHVEHDRARARFGECIDEPRVHAARPRLETRRSERFAIFRGDVRGESGAVGRQRAVPGDRQREAFAGRLVQFDDQDGLGRRLHAAHAV